MKHLGLLPATLSLAAYTAPCSQAAEEVVRHHINSAFNMYEEASLAEPGTFSIGPYIAYTRVAGGYSISVPGIYFSLGLNRRFEVSGFGAMAHSRDQQQRLSGTDDSYLDLKVLVLREGDRRPAIAVMPTFELLGSATIASQLLAPHRANFVLPVLIGKNFEAWSFSYTAGYLSRGVAFNSLKWECDRWDRVSPMAVVYASRVTNELGTISKLGFNRSQINAGAGTSIQVNRKWSISLEAVRTLSRKDRNSSDFGFSAGITFTSRLWRSSSKYHHSISVSH